MTIRYYIITAFFWILGLVPLKLLFLFSEIITFVVYHIVGYRRGVIISNLERSFPEKNRKEINFIARKYYRHLSVMIVENIYLRFVSLRRFKQKLIVEDVEIFNRYFRQSRSCVVMTGHFGNWEYGSGIIRFLEYKKGLAVYKKLADPVFDKIYYEIRSRLGVEPVEMHSVMRRVVEINKNDEPYLLFMVADQAPMESPNNHYLNFLHQPTDVFLGSEKIAKKFDMPVIYIEIIRVKKGAYRVIPQLITDTPKKTKDFEITEKFFQMLEDSIKRSPRYWLWSHRRWKHNIKN